MTSAVWDVTPCAEKCEPWAEVERPSTPHVLCNPLCVHCPLCPWRRPLSTACSVSTVSSAVWDVEVAAQILGRTSGDGGCRRVRAAQDLSGGGTGGGMGGGGGSVAPSAGGPRPRQGPRQWNLVVEGSLPLFYCGCVLGRPLWGGKELGRMYWLVRQGSPGTARTADSRTLVKRLDWRQCLGQTFGGREDLGRSTRPGHQSLVDGTLGQPSPGDSSRWGRWRPERWW